MTDVLGVDGWRRGWVGVRLRNGRFSEACVSSMLADLPADTDVEIGVDMPLSFSENGAARPFDAAARQALGSRASTLFLVPPQEVMEAATYADANRISRERYGKGISRQVYALRRKIFEAIELADARLVEVHPEVVFADLAGEPLAEPKRSWAGQQRRLRLLAERGVVMPDDLGPAGAVPADDLVDAAAVALEVWRRREVGVP